MRRINSSIYSYGNYSSSNYGAHSLRVDINNDSYWYSYETLIAFRIKGEFHIIKNYWSMTTGKHLNWINADKTIREDYETFNNNFERLTK